MRRRCAGVPLVLALAAALAACSPGGSAAAPSRTTAIISPAVAGSLPPSTDPAPATTSVTSPAKASPKTLPPGLTRADVQAGLLSATVSRSGSGTLVTVPGNIPAPSSKGALVRVKVQVEKGLRVNRTRFAAFVMATLNDPRSWGHGGARHFARVEGAYDVRVVLASPSTSASMCLPLRTFGRLSCHSSDAAVLTIYRWVKAIPGYGPDRTGYRHYLINHEVGHALGHGHEYCAGQGKIAPVMQQQTKGLHGCRPNPWPYP